VLYWMMANRRLRYNFSLDGALQHCESLGKPLLVFEALRVDYPWASDRIHRFVLDGMADNARASASHGTEYFAYVEPNPGAGKGLLPAPEENACVVVTDDFPCFFLPKMIASAARQLPVLLDRPWGPERPIFGTIRYMSSANAARRVSVKNYVRKYSRAALL
jgi:deoxyribodipyrimidine photo-lyase